MNSTLYSPLHPIPSYTIPHACPQARPHARTPARMHARMPCPLPSLSIYHVHDMRNMHPVKYGRSCRACYCAAEWQVCAAKGLVPGQGGVGMRFSYAPKKLEVYGKAKSLGDCRGWKPDYMPAGCPDGYAKDDVFYMEVCLFNQICSNGKERRHRRESAAPGYETRPPTPEPGGQPSEHLRRLPVGILLLP